MKEVVHTHTNHFDTLHNKRPDSDNIFLSHIYIYIYINFCSIFVFFNLAPLVYFSCFFDLSSFIFTSSVKSRQISIRRLDCSVNNATQLQVPSTGGICPWIMPYCWANIKMLRKKESSLSLFTLEKAGTLTFLASHSIILSLFEYTGNREVVSTFYGK